MSEFHSQNIFIPGYDEVKVSTGKLARNADGAVLVEVGNIVLLATVVYDKNSSSNDFFPLTVEYREKYSAIGKIPSGFQKREGKLTDREILLSRLVDRTIRPMFDRDFNHEIHVAINLLSANYNSTPDYLICFAASLAIYSSVLPFTDPVANICVAKVNDEYILNPDNATLKKASLNIIVGGNKNGVLMLEGNMNEVPNAEIIEAVKFAQAEIFKICEFQENFVSHLHIQRLNIEKKQNPDCPDSLKEDIKKIFLEGYVNKNDRNKKIDLAVEQYLANNPNTDLCLDTIKKNIIHEIAFEKEKRIDGRNFDEIRTINCEVDNLPCSHGSALFTRGNTQALVSVTLGSKMDEYHSDSVLGNKYDNFIVHYNFYGFATSEIKSLDKKISRRELGHGCLAMRALKCVLPKEEENPFTIRIVSDILESDGSSSMATVCGGCLAMMDAGVQIKSPVAGIAMGVLIQKENNKCIILSDISSDEDAYGDMDLKVTGSTNGFTALQLDVKVDFIPVSLLAKILDQANNGILSILTKMGNVLEKPREKTKENAPSYKIFNVSKNMIGAIIGANGKVIQSIQKNSGAIININETETCGNVKIFGYNEKIVQAAENEILNIINQPVLNEVYDGVVQTVLNYGAFVEFLPGKVGLLRTNDVDIVKIDDLPSVLKVGDRISVMLIEVLPDGKYGLSHKVLIKHEDL